MKLGETNKNIGVNKPGERGEILCSLILKIETIKCYIFLQRQL